MKEALFYGLTIYLMVRCSVDIWDCRFRLVTGRKPEPLGPLGLGIKLLVSAAVLGIAIWAMVL